MLQTSAASCLLSTSFLELVKDDAAAESVFYAVSADIEPDIGDIIAAVLAPKLPDRKKREPAPGARAEPKARKRVENSSPKGLDCYYKKLGKFAPFSAKEEADIFRSYNHIKRRIKRFKARRSTPHEMAPLERSLLGVRNEIVERNLKFVIKLAKSFWVDGNQENFENLVSAGNIGLMRAIDRFDTTRGVRFLTYAANWIALEVRIEIANDSLVKVPIWWQKTLRKLSVAFNELSKTQEPVSVKVLAKSADVPLRHVVKLSENSASIRRDQLPIARHELPLIESLLPCYDDLSAEEECIQGNARTFVHEALGRLKPQERLVIQAVYGLDDGNPQNLRQVSNVMGNTGERVRQLKEKGLESLRKKLSSPSELGGLGISSLRDIL